MKNRDAYKNKQSSDDVLNALPNLDLSYEKSEDEVWHELESLMEQTEAGSLPPKRTMAASWYRVAVAAVLVLALGAGLVMRLYTKTVHSQAGQHITAVLPDGSSVELNAGSVIKYKPLWWQFERRLSFEGEAFFKVSDGKEFEVVSSIGRTMVLGTSFNIYARKGEYKVTCYTGKVRVVSAGTGHSLDIVPNEKATINRDGTMRLSKVSNTRSEAPWVNNMFLFTRTPMSLVFEEIERQYGVTIRQDEAIDHLLYTGNFTRDTSVEEVLKMVCRPYDLKFNKIDGIYVISKE